MATTTHPVTKVTKDNHEWAKELGLTHAGFMYRKRHMTAAKVFSTPVQIQKPRNPNLKRKSKVKINTKRKVIIPADILAQHNTTPVQPSRWGEVLATLFVFAAGFAAGAALEHVIHRFF